MFFSFSFCCLYAAWQQTRCSVSVHAYSLKLSRGTVVLFINFNISVHLLIAPTVIGKTLQRVGSCASLQQVVSSDVGLCSYKKCIVGSKVVVQYVVQSKATWVLLSCVVAYPIAMYIYICTGFQYTHIMLYQRTADVCLGPYLYLQSDLTYNSKLHEEVSNSRAVVRYVECSYTYAV